MEHDKRSGPRYSHENKPPAGGAEAHAFEVINAWRKKHETPAEFKANTQVFYELCRLYGYVDAADCFAFLIREGTPGKIPGPCKMPFRYLNHSSSAFQAVLERVKVLRARVRGQEMHQSDVRAKQESLEAEATAAELASVKFFLEYPEEYDQEQAINRIVALRPEVLQIKRRENQILAAIALWAEGVLGEGK